MGTTGAEPSGTEDVPTEPSGDDVAAALPDDAAGAEATVDEGGVQDSIGRLSAAVERLAERTRADQDVIARMQARIEALQGDQVRALLGPVVTQLANLRAAVAESAARDYERLGPARAGKEIALLGDHVDGALDALGAISLGAEPGQPFDSRVHSAVKRVPTGDAARDGTVAAVLRQGFTFDPAGKPALHARVAVYAYDAALETSGNGLVPDAVSAPSSDADQE